MSERNHIFEDIRSFAAKKGKPRDREEEHE